MKPFTTIAILLIFCCGTAFAQKNLIAPGVRIPEDQLALFQNLANQRKDEFINCVKTIALTDTPAFIRQLVSDGVSLFEDTAHIAVSNKNRPKPHTYTPYIYFSKIVKQYRNVINPPIIDYESSPVFIDSVECNSRGLPVAIVGHFTFTQKTTLFNDSVKALRSTGEIHVVTGASYNDITGKTGRIRIKSRATSSGKGYEWVVLISGITVDYTK